MTVVWTALRNAAQDLCQVLTVLWQLDSVLGFNYVARRVPGHIVQPSIDV